MCHATENTLTPFGNNFVTKFVAVFNSPWRFSLAPFKTQRVSEGVSVFPTVLAQVALIHGF